MVVEKFGSKDLKEIEDPPNDYKGCIYCYAASKTCLFFRAGDTHFLRIDGELREVSYTDTGIACKSVTEAEVRRMIAEYPTYN